MLQGLMMDFPLTLTHLLTRLSTYYAKQRITTRTHDGTHQYTFAEHGSRTAQLASALSRVGVQPGDRVATLGWNSYRHFELYFAIPCMGAVIHTVNFRLHPEQVVHVMNHAEDTIVFVDASIYPLLEKIRPLLPTVRRVIVMDDVGQGTPAGTEDYEDFLASGATDFAWPMLDEQAAAGLCYTSGTTGDPKGCLYSHRSLVLHSLGVGLSGLALDERDQVLSIVPMFHVNAWGLPYGAGVMGYGLIFPGRFMQPQELVPLVMDTGVTFIGGVPTIMAGLLMGLTQAGIRPASIRNAIVGGSALSRNLLEGFEKGFGIPILQGWGMTETSPVATIGILRSHMLEWPEEDQIRQRLKQGPALPFVETRVVDEAGKALPWDGKSAGELQVRGPWVISSYYHDPRSADSFQDGWFRTGDVANIDGDGYVQLVDRVKDMVKSGGEWISSVDLENTIMGHPQIAEAAVIAVAHPKWTERPLACVVATAPGLTREDVLEYLKDKVADWWLPDDVVFLDALPKTSVGKFDKKALRAQYQDWLTR